MNHLFWVYGNLIHYNINPRLLFFGLYILLNKRKTPVFDRSPTVAFPVWHSWKLKIWRQKLMRNISKGFAIVINLTSSNAWFEGVLLGPCFYFVALAALS